MKALDELPEDLIYKRVPIKFMLLTGVRAGELNGLRWSDIDFDNQVVHIRRNRLVAKGYGIYEKEPLDCQNQCPTNEVRSVRLHAHP